jgi:hypothetical protein
MVDHVGVAEEKEDGNVQDGFKRGEYNRKRFS